MISAQKLEHPLLQAATPAAWVEEARAHPDILLIDHANCEKKAASTALALMFAYAEDLELTEKMSRLAREELRHYEQVAKLMNERLSRKELGPLLLGLSGGARGGKPRHVPTRRDHPFDAAGMAPPPPHTGA